ncbi:unnamed protein product [Alternaria alternata]
MRFLSLLSPALLVATVYAAEDASSSSSTPPAAASPAADEPNPSKHPQLKVFYNKQLYAGSWAGIDVHGTGRELIKMNMADMPYKVREWLKRESLQRHYSVQDDMVFFAPGAIYPILPLWVDDADEGGEECEGVFDGLENYSNEPKDGAVIGKISHTNTGDKEVKFTVEALKVKAKDGRDEL